MLSVYSRMSSLKYLSHACGPMWAFAGGRHALYFRNGFDGIEATGSNAKDSHPCIVSCHQSTSATFTAGEGELILIIGKVDTSLSHSRVNANASVKHFLRHTALECDTNTLGNLASIRRQNVETNNFVS